MRWSAFIILTVVFILWLLVTYYIYKRNQDQRYIDDLIVEANIIVGIAGYSQPKYKVVVSQDTTYVDNKEIIHLVIRRRDKLYTKDCLLKALLHEIAHILCPSPEHNKEFNDIETKLDDAAKLIGYRLRLDDDYPCQHE